MKQILYIGNKLAVHGKSPAAIDSLSIKLEEEGYSVITASSKKSKILRLLDMVFTTIRNIRNVDLVLIDTYSTQNFYYAVIVATICTRYKLSYIPILHGGNLPNRLTENKKVSRSLFGGAYTNVAPSIYMFEQFKQQGYNNLTYIPNTIEIKRYPFQLRETVTPKLLWVRSFSEIYNPMLALEIVVLLKKKGMEVSLCMVGPEKDGSMARCKKETEDLKLPITFTGMLQKSEWITLSKDYDIFINTTNFDNMPVSVMEAMALGMPVISTDVGGLPFLIDDGENGVLVPPDNAAAFADAIVELCEQPSKAHSIAKNARVKMEGFDWEKVKLSWIKLLDE